MGGFLINANASYVLLGSTHSLWPGAWEVNYTTSGAMWCTGSGNIICIYPALATDPWALGVCTNIQQHAIDQISSDVTSGTYDQTYINTQTSEELVLRVIWYINGDGDYQIDLYQYQ